MRRGLGARYWPRPADPAVQAIIHPVDATRPRIDDMVGWSSREIESMFLLTISGLILVAYLPAAALVTLGFLALWNRWRRPKFWQVLAATSCVVFLPSLVDGSTMHKDIWQQLGSGLIAYVPVLIPAVLWALQRRSDDGKFSTLAMKSGSLLVAYVIFVVLVLPLSAVGLLVLSNLTA